MKRIGAIALKCLKKRWWIVAFYFFGIVVGIASGVPLLSLAAVGNIVLLVGLESLFELFTMKEKIFKFLAKRGYAPEIDPEQNNVIWFTLEQWKWLILLQDRNNCVTMGLSIGMGNQVDMSMLLDRINTANREIMLAKACIVDSDNNMAFRFLVEFQCDSAGALKKHFNGYVGSIFAMARRVAELDNEFDQLVAERRQTETTYDKIHYHTAYVAIPGAISQISKYPKETAMRLDEVNYLKIGLLPHLTREEVSAFPWDELKITKVEVEHNQRLIVYEFPAPRRSPQAKFGVVLINSDGVPVDYLTLERASDDTEVEMRTPEQNTNVFWILGTVVKKEDEDTKHLNYGRFDGEPTLDNFVQTAMSIFNTPKEERTFYTRG